LVVSVDFTSSSLTTIDQYAIYSIMKTSKSSRFAAALAAAAALTAGAHAGADTLGDVDLEIVGLRNTKGVVLAGLYNSARGFGDGRHAFRYARAPVTGRTVRVSFPRLPPGEHAILVIHDEDDDGTLDTNWLGIPSEGYGASRNDLPTFSAPKWKDNRFPLAAGELKRVQIRIKY
jgi:uncharacterized protein (DUF2141 family)